VNLDEQPPLSFGFDKIELLVSKTGVEHDNLVVGQKK
jgi:hypothetical protein